MGCEWLLVWHVGGGHFTCYYMGKEEAANYYRVAHSNVAVALVARPLAFPVISISDSMTIAGIGYRGHLYRGAESVHTSRDAEREYVANLLQPIR